MLSISRPWLLRHRAAQRRNDAGRNGRAKTKRVAHRDHELADLQGVAVAEFGMRQIAGGQADHC